MHFDVDTIFINDLDLDSALHIIAKTLVMFVLILLFLRLSGRKGVRQLSIFEVAIIIGLGSAAGDPMFNEDIAVIPAVIVFATILGLYRLITWLAAKNERFETILEGNPLYIIEDGQFVLVNEGQQTYAKDEFFAEMRQQNIEHVGQVQTALLETSGTISFFYYDDDEVKPGLPTLPKVYHKKSIIVPKAGQYACTTCAYVATITTNQHRCPRCQQTEWVEAIQTRRRT